MTKFGCCCCCRRLDRQVNVHADFVVFVANDGSAVSVVRSLAAAAFVGSPLTLNIGALMPLPPFRRIARTAGVGKDN